ncbi:MAG: aldehyde dehydrogenase family protein [Mogibacterium sp.]|nr:aldehyde dehydrogenase family protein [Mogibacterium sp.]
MIKIEWTQELVHQTVEDQKKFFRTGETLDVNWRIAQLRKLKAAVKSHEAQMARALGEDLGRHPTEAYLCDIGAIILEINETIRGLKRWASPEIHYSGMLCFPSMMTKVYKMPYGTTLIISPFNFPFLLSLGVLIAAIAGGNTAVIKASSRTPACTAVLRELIKDTFSPDYVTVIAGGHDVADMCLEERFDKIFYTGSPKVAKHIMERASVNLTPLALELGGETGNWCIVRKDADLDDAARKIAFFKICNSGQVCINVNQVAVAEEVADEFVDKLKAAIVQQIGEQPHTNPEYPRLITEAAYRKCADEAELYRDRIVFGGTGDASSCRYDTTIIYPVKPDEEIVKHELFCPLLPVVPYKDAEIDSLLETIASREHGLALYIFTGDTKWAEQVMRTQQFGGGCINEVCIHLMVKGVPFNGTGHSGMGAYHGEWGFREFTHPQTVLFGNTKFNLPLREHPYSGIKNAYKDKMVRFFER